MSVTLTVTFAPEIERAAEPAPTRPGATFICRACCQHMTVAKCDNGCCLITSCPVGHPQILIRGGKAVGTSA